MNICDWKPVPKKFVLPTNKVHVYYANVMDFVGEVDGIFKLLSIDEAKKADSFRCADDYKRYVIAHALLRSIIGHYLELPPNTIIFKSNKYGKPNIANGKNIHFNISHSMNGILLAFTMVGDVGVDIEWTQNGIFIENVVNSYFSRYEIQSFFKTAEKDSVYFYTLWTRKEAFIKAIGLGMSCSLDKFSIVSNKNQLFQWMKVPIEDTSSGMWIVKSIRMCKSYRAAIAVQGYPLPVLCWRFSDIEEWGRVR